MSIYSIYKLTSPSGKHYIGLTSNLTKRLRWHKSSTSGCRALKNAVNKYGIDSFTIEILEQNLSKEDACIQEDYFITLYNSLAPSGYNLKTGGIQSFMSDDTKRKMSESRRGKLISERTRQLLSEKHTGKHLSNSTKEKIREIRLQQNADRIQTLIPTYLDQIREYYLIFGSSPKSNHFQSVHNQYNWYSIGAITKAFGSWNKAVAEAGLTPAYIATKYR